MQHERFYLPNVAGAMQNERFCRLTLQNAEHIANTMQTYANSLVCFSAFLAWMISPVFFLLGFAKLYGRFDFMVLFVFRCSPLP